MTDEAKDRLWNIMEGFNVALLITHSANDVRGRPMGVTVEREEDALYFLTSASGSKDEEIQSESEVIVAFVDPSGQQYAWVRGRATVSNDRDKIKDLWTVFAKAWWRSADDPDIRVIRVTPHTAEYWDSPGTILSYASMLTSALVGGKPQVGDNRKVAL